MAPHSSILSWRTPCTEEPGGLRVRQDWTTEHAVMQTGFGAWRCPCRPGERAASTPSVPLCHLGQVALTHPLAGAGDRGHAGVLRPGRLGEGEGALSSPTCC